jgi:hypothetical protein
MLQLQFEPGSMPAASTSATNVATGGSTATGCAAATTVARAGTGDGAAVVDGVVEVDAGATAGEGTDVGVVVAGPSAAPVGLARVGIELVEGTDGARWGLSTTTVVSARAEARPAATSRTGRLP